MELEELFHGMYGLGVTAFSVLPSEEAQALARPRVRENSPVVFMFLYLFLRIFLNT